VTVERIHQLRQLAFTAYQSKLFVLPLAIRYEPTSEVVKLSQLRFAIQSQ